MCARARNALNAVSIYLCIKTLNANNRIEKCNLRLPHSAADAPSFPIRVCFAIQIFCRTNRLPSKLRVRTNSRTISDNGMALECSRARFAWRCTNDMSNVSDLKTNRRPIRIEANARPVAGAFENRNGTCASDGNAANRQHEMAQAPCHHCV